MKTVSDFLFFDSFMLFYTVTVTYFLFYDKILTILRKVSQTP